VPVRDVDLHRHFAGVPKYFVADDIVMSHVFAMLSATFPDGEDYFVRSVAAVRDRIDDDRLAEAVDGFIGQESMHGREHRAFNRHLSTMGYPTRLMERYTKRAFGLFERVDRRRLHLGVTAALEHYTATLAELLLTDPDARAVFSHDAVRRLFLWHALEEAEHKAVAFDAYRYVGGSERMRRLTMAGVHLDFLAELVGMTVVSVALDPDARRHPWRVVKGLGRLLRSPFLSVGAVGQLVQYQRRGFHPNDRDTSELVTRWRHELFGSVDEATATDGAESRVGSDANRRVARSGQGQNGGPVSGPSARLTGTDATGPAT
jgi:predicted metal-dependent hydrolase